MILIETSDDKAPLRELFGDRSPDSECVLKYLDTAFYEGVDDDKRKECKAKDGHVPRNMRICLSLIDLAAPYINVKSVEHKGDEVDVDWKVGGSVTVDSNQILWVELDSENDLDDKIFEKVDDSEHTRFRVRKDW